MVNHIVKMIRNAKKNIESNLPALEMEIDLMIENKEKCPKNIERILDILLDYSYMGVGENQFIKLNNYYSKFYPENAAEYDKFYHEVSGR